ncbi:MAG: hypothetical protein R3255_09950 [Candidatus Lokiarchaeia archaeon]|nr:hypothetical protein [Candidatus Lokiarchaeia archaeon]
MPTPDQKKFIEDVIRIIDRWSFEQCAHCENGTLLSIDGMLDFKCSKCGKDMNPSEYLGEIAKTVFKYREKLENKKRK